MVAATPGYVLQVLPAGPDSATGTVLKETRGGDGSAPQVWADVLVCTVLFILLTEFGGECSSTSYIALKHCVLYMEFP